MANIFSDVDIKRFRLRAKHLSRVSKIRHSEALDAVAHEQGFSTWALLMKHVSSEVEPPVAEQRRVVLLSDLASTPPRTAEDIRRAFAQGRFAELKPDQA